MHSQSYDPTGTSKLNPFTSDNQPFELLIICFLNRAMEKVKKQTPKNGVYRSIGSRNDSLVAELQSGFFKVFTHDFLINYALDRNSEGPLCSSTFVFGFLGHFFSSKFQSICPGEFFCHFLKKQISGMIKLPQKW